MVAEVMDELGIRDRTIGVAPVGCSVLAYNYFNCDMQQAAHGRAPAVATGIKRVLPESVVFAYQGDGDLASIGTAEIVHAAARGENITVIFINNAIYGMTGGQMAPTTLIGQKTETTPYGRDPGLSGYPVKVCEMLSVLDGPAFIARAALTDVKSILKAKAFIKKAFEMQMEKRGFTLVEILSPCPTNWGMTPQEAMKWVNDRMTAQFPPGVFKEPEEVSV
jgi:2-oxoglutarate ferredoxin oxidoreductase subunit beta